MIKNWKYICVVILGVVFFLSCEEENTPHVLGECFEIGPPNNGGWSTGWVVETRSYNYQRPVCSPTNPNEFVYILNHDTGALQMRKHNWLTNEDELIVYRGAFYQLRYGVNHHLIFNSGGNQVWAVKDNGDSLRQLTNFPYMCLYPDWAGGQSFIYYQDLGIGNSRHIKADFEGNTIDTLNYITAGGAPSQCCSPDGKYMAFSVGASQKFIYDLQVETLKVINHTSAGNVSMSFSADGTKIIWTYNGSLYITDIISEQTTLIKESCESKGYTYPGISADGQKIIAMREDKIDKSPTKLYVEGNIVIMNIDGSNEQIVELPH